MIPGGLEGVGVFVPTVFFVMFFSYCSVKVWMNGRKQEREAFYKSETLRRITEAPGEGAKAAIELMREDSRMERIKRFEGLKLGGLICVAVGVAMAIFVRGLMGPADRGAPYLIGLIPGLIGVAMLVYVYASAGHWEQGPKD